MDGHHLAKYRRIALSRYRKLNKKKLPAADSRDGSIRLMSPRIGAGLLYALKQQQLLFFFFFPVFVCFGGGGWAPILLGNSCPSHLQINKKLRAGNLYLDHIP